jgi:hypothetical protein
MGRRHAGPQRRRGVGRIRPGGLADGWIMPAWASARVGAARGSGSGSLCAARDVYCCVGHVVQSGWRRRPTRRDVRTRRTPDLAPSLFWVADTTNRSAIAACSSTGKRGTRLDDAVMFTTSHAHVISSVPQFLSSRTRGIISLFGSTNANVFLIANRKPFFPPAFGRARGARELIVQGKGFPLSFRHEMAIVSCLMELPASRAFSCDRQHRYC